MGTPSVRRCRLRDVGQPDVGQRGVGQPDVGQRGDRRRARDLGATLDPTSHADVARRSRTACIRRLRNSTASAKAIAK